MVLAPGSIRLHRRHAQVLKMALERLNFFRFQLDGHE